MKLILPLYDLRLATRVTAAAGPLPGTIVICNPWDGPGKEFVPKWNTVINRLRNEGARVLGYVDAVQWPGEQGAPDKKRRTKLAKEVLLEVTRWTQFYGVNDIFFDDCVKAPPNGMFSDGDFINPGSHPGFAVPEGCGVVTWEQPGTPPAKAQPPGPPTAAMCLNIPHKDLPKTWNRCRAAGFDYFFATERPEIGAYDQMPSYIDELVRIAA